MRQSMMMMFSTIVLGLASDATASPDAERSFSEYEWIISPGTAGDLVLFDLDAQRRLDVELDDSFHYGSMVKCDGLIYSAAQGSLTKRDVEGGIVEIDLSRRRVSLVLPQSRLKGRTPKHLFKSRDGAFFIVTNEGVWKYAIEENELHQLYQHDRSRFGGWAATPDVLVGVFPDRIVKVDLSTSQVHEHATSEAPEVIYSKASRFYSQDGPRQFEEAGLSFGDAPDFSLRHVSAFRFGGQDVFHSTDEWRVVSYFFIGADRPLVVVPDLNVNAIVAND